MSSYSNSNDNDVSLLRKITNNTAELVDAGGGGGGGGGGGDATAANQVTGNASLATIASKTTSLDANQVTGNASLATIASKTTSLDANQVTGNASLATIASKTSAINAKVNNGTGPMAVGLTVTTSEARSVIGSQLTSPVINTELLTNTINGWYDAKDFNAASFTVVTGAGISAGVLTFESVDDTTLTAAQVPVRVGNSATTAPVTTLNLNASTTIRYNVNLSARYFRVRVSTAVTGGTVQVFATFRQQSFADQGLAISNVGTVATLSGTTSLTPGNGAANLGKNEDATAGSGDTGVFVLGVRRDTLTTSASASADYNELSTNRFGAQYVADFRTSARTYSASANVTVAATATDIAALFGNGTTTVAITKICLTGIQTTTGTVDVQVIFRTAANTGGTSSAMSLSRHEQADSANSSTPISYTANPSALGTAAGTLHRFYLPVAAATSGLSGEYTLEFGDNGKPIILAGTAQGIAINLNGVTVTGGIFNVVIEWYEF